MAFCASDISRNRKMGLSFKIYDTPYWTEAPSSTHPSNQPPESASTAHHVLMNMINPCAGSLWTPFKHPPPPETSYSCCRSSNVLTSINSTLAFLYKRKQNNNASLERHKQRAEQMLSTEDYNSTEVGTETEDAFPVHSESSWTSPLSTFYFIATFALCLCHHSVMLKWCLLALFTHTFLNRSVTGGSLLWFTLLRG